MPAPLESVVIGAGQAGLSASFHLARRGIDHVVLDADAEPGGAWQHRWDSLAMVDVHGVASLPGSEPPNGAGPANTVVPAYFGAYERAHRLPVVRPVRVSRVEPAEDDLLLVSAGQRSWVTRTIVNATGTWSQPYVPYYPGAATFGGEQLHTHDYPGAAHFRGRRVVVVGGGASAVQFLGELALVVDDPARDLLWVTRREPIWRTEGFDPEAGSAAVALVEERVRRGLPPASVVSVTGLMLRPQEAAAARLGVYERRLPMFASIEPSGVRWADGTFRPADVILWATGFRPAVAHLAPLHLRSAAGGIQLDRFGTTAVADPRVQLVGYGPSASTIGANRAGRFAARGVAAWLDGQQQASA
ncbi:NAD(P)-binding domain-containing protein [Nocardioides sp. CER19]|uniref:NAD(P)-binding domain-containing protein n=1 Tax=Nocardioides sp. CER19 TaxID=3038538 RepID=UPI00244B9FE5|nr:NAD(P)-binding domain-containing protein [Nocardioides sp. CER19]MDH2415196.1 NAD(P)-binding domain-containing protein [Nocardioides sp. CER19]